MVPILGEVVAPRDVALFVMVSLVLMRPNKDMRMEHGVRALLFIVAALLVAAIGRRPIKGKWKHWLVAVWQRLETPPEPCSQWICLDRECIQRSLMLKSFAYI